MYVLEMIMRQTKFLMICICVLSIEIWESTATKILYVLSDNSTNPSCSYQLCAPLDQYLLDDGILPVVTNVEYHFSPGEHHIPANMVLQNLHNFSIVGIVSKASSPAVLVGCFHSHVLKIYTSRNVNIRNIMFKRCYNPQLQLTIYFTSLDISQCFSCVIENVTFENFGIVGKNLIGQSTLNEIYITHTTGQFCQGITLGYMDHDQLLTDEYHLLINKLYITGIGNGSKCYNFNDHFIAGLRIYIGGHAKNATVTISNSFFKGIHSTAIYVSSHCPTSKSILSFHNCAFYSVVSINKPVVQGLLSKYNNFISFNNCTFKHNYAEYSVISIQIQQQVGVLCRYISTNQHFATLSSIYFRENQFMFNSGTILTIRGDSSNRIILIIGPLSILHNKAVTEYPTYLTSIQNMDVHMYGPVIISYNGANKFSILLLVSSEITFYGAIILKYNFCDQIISLNGNQP